MTPPLLPGMIVNRKAVYLLSILLTMCFLTAALAGDSFKGKVVKVIDGDTLDVLRGHQIERIRLWQIDAPERYQPFGLASKQYLLEVAANRVVTVRVETVDSYGRTVGEIFLPDGRNLNQQIVANGYAWHYRRFSKGPEYGEMEQLARSRRAGLWQDKKPIPPWLWRDANRNLSPQVERQKAEPLNNDFTCGTKQYCAEMSSCEEAIFFLVECGINSLDGNQDGIPCESLCR